MEQLNSPLKRKTLNQKRRDRRAAFIFFAIILIGAIIGIFYPGKEYSSYDNTPNSPLPSAKADFISGQMQSEYEAYVNDSFFLNDILKRADSSITSFLGQHEKNGVLKGKDGYLIDIFETPDNEIMKAQLKAINRFASENIKDISSVMVIVPTKSNILSDKMPLSGYGADQKAYIDNYYKNLNNVSIVDLTQAMSDHYDEDIYYKTDSTWTSLGAYYGYNEIASKMRWDVSDDKYESLLVSSNFRGDLSYRSGFGSTSKEKIYVYFNAHKEFGTVTTLSDGTKKASMFDRPSLKTSKQLDVFLGDDFNEVTIDSTCLKDDRLLVIGDSYARAIVPFFTGQYETVCTIDADTYNGDLDQFIRQHHITQVMFLFGANSLEKCDNLSNFLK